MIAEIEKSYARSPVAPAVRVALVYTEDGCRGSRRRRRASGGTAAAYCHHRLRALSRASLLLARLPRRVEVEVARHRVLGADAELLVDPLARLHRRADRDEEDHEHQHRLQPVEQAALARLLEDEDDGREEEEGDAEREREEDVAVLGEPLDRLVHRAVGRAARGRGRASAPRRRAGAKMLRSIAIVVTSRKSTACQSPWCAMPVAGVTVAYAKPDMTPACVAMLRKFCVKLSSRSRIASSRPSGRSRAPASRKAWLRRAKRHPVHGALFQLPRTPRRPPARRCCSTEERPAYSHLSASRHHPRRRSQPAGSTARRRPRRWQLASRTSPVRGDARPTRRSQLSAGARASSRCWRTRGWSAAASLARISSSVFITAPIRRSSLALLLLRSLPRKSRRAPPTW